MESDVEESLRKRPRKYPFSADSSSRKFEQYLGRPFAIIGEVNFMQDDDNRLEITRTRCKSLLKMLMASFCSTICHWKVINVQTLELQINMDSDKIIFERLQKEFEAARASQTEEICLDGDAWNDGLLATIRERVHMESDRKAMHGDADILSCPHEKITYKIGNKVICCLEGARIGVQYETSYAGEPCEFYHCVLESKSFLEKMTVLEHTVPFFLPIREIENDLLSSNAMKFIDHVGDLLQAFVDRREQVRLIKELYGNQIRELYHSLPYHMIELVLDDSDCKVTVSLRYADLISVLPTRISVLAWPMFNKNTTATLNRKEDGLSGSHSTPIRLTYAEDALRTMSLPEAYAEIVLNLPQALQQTYHQKAPA
ncbi:hypothetical protein VIGAN_02090200 [Vigna angularis var. angularis]|uniref:Centromere protein O n=1 Tax=Vigna angularis var. angularis TaxID=157739 RepID=A0A0S3RCI9_PHAAN|nr:uncharacterized protein LOC108331991 isoform X2 [Vigna angularis]BAT78250.1 hypothetical protein VIGAN_02090200 [Vigna angularis var. angularis]